MAVSYVDPFSGKASTTCSVGAAYASKVQAIAGHRLTEAQWEKHQHLGTWGVIKGKLTSGTMPDLPFAEMKYGGNVHHKFGVKDGNLTQYNVNTGVSKELSVEHLDVYVDMAGEGLVDEWKWLGQHTPDAPSVPLGSKSVGSMSDEDVAALFVKTKDDFATAKGINIKGSNPQLDSEVFSAIANQIGYTASEVKAKVDAYKSTGKKLSALKKKVKKGTAKVVEVKAPLPPKAAATGDKVPDPDPVLNFDGAVKVDKEVDPFKGQKVYIDGQHVGYVRKYESQVPVMGKTNYSVGYTKEIKWYVHDVNGKKIDSIWPPKTQAGAVDKLRDHLKKSSIPNATLKHVPVEAAEDIVKEAVEEIVAKTPHFLDEEVAKAYIKAKDQLAADTSNPWTLYTQKSKEFEEAITHLMSKYYDIDLHFDAIENQLARYLGGGNKLSVLKKKMAKTGEYVPQADTLKIGKTKAGKDNTPTSKTQAKKQIDEMVGVYEPDKWQEIHWKFGQENFVFENLKNDLYAAMNEEAVFQKFLALHNNWKDYYPTEKAPDLLNLVRVYDKKKAAQLGIENGGFYEKKLVSYASSPEGKSKILNDKIAKEKAAEFEASLPPLPADSKGFNEISTRAAQDMQNGMGAWTGEQSRALRKYTGGSYTEINGYLRGTYSYGSSYRITINEAQAGMKPVTQDLIVHRGCSFAQFGMQSYEQALGLIGKTVEEKGFLSTSVGGRAAFGGSVLLEVELPKGAHAAYIKSISRRPGENELLIAHGTKFKVLTVKKDGYQTTVRVRAIPGSHKKGTI